MPILGVDVKQRLRSRGIDTGDDMYGNRYNFTLGGLYWLLNYLNETKPRNTSFSLALFKSLATTQPTKQWRALRVKSSGLPVYNTAYQQLAIYLEGTPPVWLLNTPANHDLPEVFSLLDVRPFTLARVSQGTSVDVMVSEAERGRLAAGECLGFNDQGALGAT